MAKRKKSADAAEAEAQAASRAAAVSEYNRNNMGVYWIDESKTPTEDDVTAAKKEYDDAVEALSNHKYFIADKANAKRVAEFLKKWLETCFWTQRGFVGVINFDAYLEDFLKELETEEKDLELDYGPMQFCFLLLENFAGSGLESAKKMAEIWDEYVPIYDKFRENIEWYQTEVEKVNDLKTRWGMFAQGFYFIILKTYEKADDIVPTYSDEVESAADTETPVEHEDAEA